jgi:hypothetical protein
MRARPRHVKPFAPPPAIIHSKELRVECSICGAKRGEQCIADNGCYKSIAHTRRKLDAEKSA